MNPTEIENLAVMFRSNDRNLGHISTLDAMQELGLAFSYGVFHGTPPRYRQTRRILAADIARRLDEIAEARRRLEPKA
jgi:hypothetical protein